MEKFNGDFSGVIVEFFRSIVREEMRRCVEEKQLMQEEIIDDVESAAKFFGVSKQTIYALKDAGEIDFLQIGRTIKFRRSSLLKAFERRNQ